MLKWAYSLEVSGIAFVFTASLSYVKAVLILSYNRSDRDLGIRIKNDVKHFNWCVGKILILRIHNR